MYKEIDTNSAPKLTKIYKIVDPTPTTSTMQDSQDVSGGTLYASHSWYQRLVQGSSTRQTRYREYDNMDDDVDISRALDTVAEEMTQINRKTKLPLNVNVQDPETKMDSHELMTLRAALRAWVNIHDFEDKLFDIARNTVKYGDCFFRKHDATKSWEYIHPKNMIAAVVDELDVTHIIAWQIRKDSKRAQANVGGIAVSGQQYETEFIPADEIVNFTLNDDMSDTAPFGESILKPVYRAFKQKQLLEDAVIIYRISRAPERRVFHIDIGKMPPHRAKQYLEQVKNELRQKKIPTRGGAEGQNPQIESVYNPHSTNEDYFFAQRADGKGSRVETLPGGTGLGELADLEYFLAKVYRGLRIPTSYMHVTGGESNPVFNDGRVGQAYIEELRFAEFCMRLQRKLECRLDQHFKAFLHDVGIADVDITSFKLTLPEPTNFGIYKQQEADSALLGTLSQAESIPFLSKRFVLARFGQMTEEEILHNEHLLKQERGLTGKEPNQLKVLYGAPEEEEGGGLGGLGGGDIGGGMMGGGMEGDFDMGEEGEFDEGGEGEFDEEPPIE